MNTNKNIKAPKLFNAIELNKGLKSPFEKCNARLAKTGEFHLSDFRALVDLLVNRHHNNLSDQASVIYDLSNNLFRKDGYLYPNLSKVIEHLFLFFHDLLCQFKKEEQILFPGIIELVDKRLHEGSFNYSTYGMVMDYAQEMKKQHKSMLNNLQIFSELTGNYRVIDGDCRSYVTLMEKIKAFEIEVTEHIYLESEVLIHNATALNER